jgi:hypothetical protein
MDLTVHKNPAKALDIAENAFDALAKKRFGGINTRASAFDKGTLFHTERK